MASAGVASTATTATAAASGSSQEYVQATVTTNVAPSFVFECDPSTEGPSAGEATSRQDQAITGALSVKEVPPGALHSANSDNLNIMYQKNATANPLIFGRMHSEPERSLPLIELTSLQPPVELQTLNPNHRSCPEISPDRCRPEQPYAQSMSVESSSSRGPYGPASSGHRRCSVSPRVKRHLWPSHARSGASRLEHSFLTRTVSRESMRLSTHALNAGVTGNGNSSSCSEIQPLMAAICHSGTSNYLSSCPPPHGPYSASGHHLVGSSPLRAGSTTGGVSGNCCASNCAYHHLPPSQQHHHRTSALENEIAEIAADSMRINGALSQFRQLRQLRKATNASTLSMPAAEKGSFTAANSLEVTADASTPLMNATSDHRTPQQFLSQRSFASNSLDSEKKKSTTIKSGFHKPNVGYRLGRRKGKPPFIYLSLDSS